MYFKNELWDAVRALIVQFLAMPDLTSIEDKLRKKALAEALAEMDSTGHLSTVVLGYEIPTVLGALMEPRMTRPDDYHTVEQSDIHRRIRAEGWTAGTTAEWDALMKRAGKLIAKDARLAKRRGIEAKIETLEEDLEENKQIVEEPERRRAEAKVAVAEIGSEIKELKEALEGEPNE